ncbi:MAG: hypothetical protein ACO24P_03725 [Candidatus Nanopelagicaceae bacterium]
MSTYVVQVCYGRQVDYKEVDAYCYEDARDKIAAELTIGEVIAVTRRPEL